MNQFHIKTFGCQMNVYDSARMAGLLAESWDGREVDDPAQADLIVFNTCHIREKAEEKLFSELGRLRKLVRDRPVIFAVGGCVGQAEGERIFERAPYVQLVFGPQNYHRLPELLRRVSAGERRVRDVEEGPAPKFDDLPPMALEGAAAMVTVQEGCDRFCNYCVVPFTRGREWSRPVADVVREVEGLVARGVREVCLLGQNVNAYTAPDEDGVTCDLALLIRRVALLPGVDRIRFATSHPADMSPDLVEVFAEVEALCPYLHLPVQSGSDRILAAMGRNHVMSDYATWVARLRAARPGIVLSTDFIVGFPGEGEAEFQETLDWVQRIGFDQAYSFKFSARPGTVAATLDGQVEEAVKSERLARLQSLLDAQQWASNRQQIGKVEPVLVAGAARQDKAELAGRTPGWRQVNFPGDPSLVGKIVPVRIVDGLPNSLRGELAE